MEISNYLIEKIKEFEGLRLYSYRDSGGVPTVGYGHTRGVRMGLAITKQQAENLLLEDLKPAIENVQRLGVCKTQGQFDALVDFVFNLGYSSLVGSTLLKKIKQDAPTSEIQAQFKRWVYCKGRVLEGLVKRREWEAQRWTE